MGKLGADMDLPEPRFAICVMSEKFGFQGLPGQILVYRATLEGAEDALSRINSGTLVACGGGRTKPLGDAVIGIVEGHKWL